MQLVLVVQHSHLLLCSLQALLAKLQQLGPTLIRSQGLFQRQLAFFHLTYDFGKIGERGFEILGGDVFGHGYLSVVKLSKKEQIGQIGFFKVFLAAQAMLSNHHEKAFMKPFFRMLFHLNRTPADDLGDTHWIGELPQDNPLAALDTILHKLATLVPVEMPADTWRLKTLTLIDTHCRHHVAALEQQYIQIQKLRPELDAHMWDAVYGWHRYQLRGYLTFIDAYTAHPDQSEFDSRYLPLIVARAIHHQANIARWRYMRYQGMPDGGWLQLHRLYALAEREGFGGKLIKLYEDLPEMTVGERYVEALMLDTLNHTNMSKLQIQLANSWVATWSKAISVARDFDTQRFIFFADMNEDRSARRIRNFTPTPSCRYWETDRMVMAIDRARKALEQGKTPTEAGLMGNGKPADCLPLLNQLFTEWSRTEYQRQRRGEDRRKVMTTAIVANGMAEVWQQIKDVAQSINRHRGGYVPVEGKTLDERLASHSVAITTGGPIIAFAGAVGERWLISDESTSGFGAKVGPEVADWAKLGRLVAIVTEDNREQVAVGVIRSLKQLPNSQRHIGIEVITRKGTAIQLTTQITHATQQGSGDVFLDAVLTNPGFNTIPGILIPADKPRGIARSILLPTAEFDPCAIYEASRGIERHTVHFGKVADQKDDWVRVVLEEGHDF